MFKIFLVSTGFHIAITLASTAAKKGKLYVVNDHIIEFFLYYYKAFLSY